MKSRANNIVLIILMHFPIFAQQEWVEIHAFTQSQKQNEVRPDFRKLGNHIIVEFLGCKNLNESEKLAGVLREAARAAGATVLAIETHQFYPQGMSGIAILQESHIALHTWPEYGYAAIDIFTCGQHVDPERALKVLQDFFGPQTIEVIRLSRGF